MKAAVFGQSDSKKNLKAWDQLVTILEKKGVSIWVESQFYSKISNETHYNTFDSLDKSFDLVVSIGGDGTILRATTLVKDLNIPIVGINTGRLGFLATIQLNEIEVAFNEILAGTYKISERSMLQVQSSIDQDAFNGFNFAFNEVAVSRKNTTSMITVETHLDDEYLTSYWADGLILATPTGSTGYSLSCGGPVITPGSNNFVLTPIAPHNLSARPLVFKDDTEIRLKVSGREDQFLLSLDSRIITLPNKAVLTIKKSPYKTKLVELANESFLDTLRKKLLWGEDPRN